MVRITFDFRTFAPAWLQDFLRYEIEKGLRAVLEKVHKSQAVEKTKMSSENVGNAKGP